MNTIHPPTYVVLYASNLEQRLKQEIVLGMGGMQVLNDPDIHPAALHLNEGHPALAILEPIRSFVEGGADCEEATNKVRESTIFTTHTPAWLTDQDRSALWELLVPCSSQTFLHWVLPGDSPDTNALI